MSEASSEGFTPSYPSWFLLRGDSLGPNGEMTPDSELLTMQNDRGELPLPIFTDTDMADIFHEASDDLPSNLGFSAVDAPEKLATILDAAQLLGIQFVVFDPPRSTGTHPRAWSIAYAAERIRNGQDLL